MSEHTITFTLAKTSGCFDLQFRKDTRHLRLNSPTYYRWKAQFVITLPKSQAGLLEKVKKEMACGQVHFINRQARFSVQDIDNIIACVIPFFTKHQLAEKKKKDFELWRRAVEIISRNKGKPLAGWKKNDLITLVQIHKSTMKYKIKPKQSRWVEIAQSLAKR